MIKIYNLSKGALFMDFILGCNYWASNAGVDMWKDYNKDAINEDLRILSEHGVKHLRVFPNWRDFQPVIPRITGSGVISGYSFDEGQTPDNPYFLSEIMLDRFSEFLEICKKYKIKIIVGLITGWMSGGLFVPSALYGKNVITDELALYFEQLFIKGFVSRFKDSDVIYAWDLGNECNCMAEVKNRFEAASWTALISNAIRAVDSSRPVISGMHSLEVQGNWTIEDQGLFTDILTTHPYAYWCEHTKIDKALSLRTTLHPTAQTRYYSDISQKPCFAEEIGTMGPMLLNDEKAPEFLRINFFSLWANGSDGIMWWCANDQSKLFSYPYIHQMVEQELGLIDNNRNPKPVLRQMKKIAEFLDNIPFILPPAKTDAVCVLTSEQDQWGVGYMTYILSKQAGLNISFAYSDNALPDSKLYLMPSANGVRIMPKKRYEELKEKVLNGADLYISADDAIFSEFESLTGLKIEDSYEYTESGKTEIDGKQITFSRLRNRILTPVKATVIAYDNENNPFITVNKYGKGRVFFVNAPIEKNLIDKHNAFEENHSLIYQTIFKDYIDNIPVALSDNNLIMTYHPSENGAYIVILNHYDKEKSFTMEIDKAYTLEKVFYGSVDKINAFDACILKINKV